MRRDGEREIATASRLRRPARALFPQWHRYEREKAAWTQAHPEATGAEYDAAIRAIAKRLGV